MTKKNLNKVGSDIFDSLDKSLRKPLIDALGIYGFVKILSIIVDRDYLPHSQYIALIMLICFYSGITSQERKQIYTSIGFVAGFSSFLILRHLEFEGYAIIIPELIFIFCLIFNLVFYIKKMFEFKYGKTLTPTIFFMIIYFSLVFLQPNISIEVIDRPIINFSRIELSNFISMNYRNEYQVDHIYTIWNVFTLLLSSYSLKGKFKKR